jgi:beta-ureidopropionase / N-carbamoyl-L-amino-acid hydrolase
MNGRRAAPAADPARFAALWRTLTPLGRHDTGYLRLSWSDSDLAVRDWFTGQARARDLTVETDRAGNLWAWWGDPAAGGAVVTGSHLDSVPHGGAYDGPLGVAAALLAVDLLRERGVRPARPLGIVAFTEEEGARFGVACLGSRVLTGEVTSERALGLVDQDGVDLATAMTRAGADPARLGPDPDRVAGLRAYVELHIEQGRGLVDLGAAVGVATGIWPHGRWRLELTGTANHAGTTALADRRDPVLTLARAVVDIAALARVRSVHAGVGRIRVHPGATNAVAGRVTAWLDARAPEKSTLDEFVAGVSQRLSGHATADRTRAVVVAESLSPAVTFDPDLRDTVARLIGGAPYLPTAAGHDAGVLAAAGVPAAMLFVRNPTGVSHAPEEHASDVDCAAGVAALAAVLTGLTGP